MKFIFIITIWLFALASCKGEPKVLSEDFQAICFVSNGDEIGLGNEVYMNSPTIHYVLFLYHDTIFQVQIKDKKNSWSYLTPRNKGKDSLIFLFRKYDNTTLKEQLHLLKKRKYTVNSSCGPEGYFLCKKHEKLNFGLFNYRDYSYWSRYYYWKETKLHSYQFPKIYSTIYHTFNSKQWDYLMSDDYYYKDVRTYQKVRFQFEPTAKSK